MDLYAQRQICSVIGQVDQILGNRKDSIFTGSATLHSAGGVVASQTLTESKRGDAIYHFKDLPPGSYHVTFAAPHYTVTYAGGGATARTITSPRRPAPGVLPLVDPLPDSGTVPFTRFDLGKAEATYVPPSTTIRVISYRFQAGGYSSGLESTAALVRALPDGWSSYEGGLRNLPYGSFDYWISSQGSAFASATEGSDHVLAYTDVQPATGQMLLKVSRRSAGGEWLAPITVATAGGIVNVGVTRLDPGSWLGVWTQIAPADADNPFPPSTLMFSHSADGLTWSPPQSLAALAGVAAQLRIAASGNQAVLAFAETDQGPSATDYTIKTATWDGAAWTTPSIARAPSSLLHFELEGVPQATPPSFHLAWLENDGALRSLTGPRFEPVSTKVITTNAVQTFDLTTSASAPPLVAWRNTSHHVELARWDATNWLQLGPAISNAMPAELRLSHLAQSVDTRILVAWTVGAPRSVYYAFLDSAGRTLQPPTLLTSDSTQGHRDLELSVGPNSAARIFARRQSSSGAASATLLGQTDGAGVSLVELTVPAGDGPRLGSPRLTADGRVEFFLQGDVTRRFRIQSSADLETWTDLATEVTPDDATPIRDTIGTTSSRFYRAVTP